MKTTRKKLRTAVPTKWIKKIVLPDGAKPGETPPQARQALQVQPKTYAAKPTAKLLRAKSNLLRRLNRHRKAAEGLRDMGKTGLLGIENILSVSIGEKITRGKRTRKPCLIVQVKRKRASRLDPQADISRLHSEKRTGILSDVQATGCIMAHYADGRYRPCAGGASMCSQVVQEGTVACVVSIPDNGGGRELCFLGCNHTFAGCNSVGLDDWIIQPSPVDGGVFPDDAIARLRKFHPLDFSPSGWNEVDCALVGTLPELKDGRVYEIGAIQNDPLESNLVGRQVAKYGTTTGLTYGVITDDNVTSRVTYIQPKPAEARFRRLIKISSSGQLPFSGPGDSGALILDVLTRRPIGLVIGGDNTFSYGCRISKVLSVLNARIEPAP